MVEDGLGLGKLQVRFRDGADRLLAKENDALTGPGRGRRRARLIQIRSLRLVLLDHSI
jgi:hypothetical protein